MLESCAATVERAYRSGAVLGFGTDFAPMSPQYEKGVEFQFRKEYCHMENLDIPLQPQSTARRSLAYPIGSERLKMAWLPIWYW